MSFGAKRRFRYACKDRNYPDGVKGKKGHVTQAVGAFYQMFFASTRAATKGTDAYHSPSAKGAGVTKYRVDIPKCKKDCQCLIVVSVEGSISGEVNAMASDWGFGKARATIDAKLYSSLGIAQAQLALASGDGGDLRSFRRSRHITQGKR